MTSLHWWAYCTASSLRRGSAPATFPYCSGSSRLEDRLHHFTIQMQQKRILCRSRRASNPAEGLVHDPPEVCPRVPDFAMWQPCWSVCPLEKNRDRVAISLYIVNCILCLCILHLFTFSVIWFSCSFVVSGSLILLEKLTSIDSALFLIIFLSFKIKLLSPVKLGANRHSRANECSAELVLVIQEMCKR